jgi:hypothetical protein
VQPNAGATVTIAEAAELSGLSKIALRRRIERGSLPAVRREGVRRIPLAELRRQGLLREESGRGSAGALTPAGHPGWGELLDRLAAQERELLSLRALPAEAESLRARFAEEAHARRAAESALQEARARMREVEARLARRASLRGRLLETYGDLARLARRAGGALRSRGLARAPARASARPPRSLPPKGCPPG